LNITLGYSRRVFVRLKSRHSDHPLLHSHVPIRRPREWRCSTQARVRHHALSWRYRRVQARRGGPSDASWDRGPKAKGGEL